MTDLSFSGNRQLGCARPLKALSGTRLLLAPWRRGHGAEAEVEVYDMLSAHPLQHQDDMPRFKPESGLKWMDLPSNRKKLLMCHPHGMRRRR